jgi:hypothetical protein
MAILGTMLGYVSPGGLLSAIGVFFALLATGAFTVVGFVWYPFQRLLDRLRRRKQEPPAPPAQPPGDSTG